MFHATGGFLFISQSEHLSHLVIGGHQTLLPPLSLYPLQQLLKETEKLRVKTWGIKRQPFISSCLHLFAMPIHLPCITVSLTDQAGSRWHKLSQAGHQFLKCLMYLWFAGPAVLGQSHFHCKLHSIVWEYLPNVSAPYAWRKTKAPFKKWRWCSVDMKCWNMW